MTTPTITIDYRYTVTVEGKRYKLLDLITAEADRLEAAQTIRIKRMLEHTNNVRGFEFEKRTVEVTPNDAIYRQYEAVLSTLAAIEPAEFRAEAACSILGSSKGTGERNL